MKKKILLLLFFLAVLASIIGVTGRYNAENSANGVELIMDYDSLRELEVSEVDYLKKLKKNGLTAVAIYPDSIKEILNKGEAQLITANELKRILSITGEINPLLAAFPYNENSAFLIIDEFNYLKRLGKVLPGWEKKYNIEYYINDQQAVIFFDKWEHKYINLSLGFNEEIIANIRNIGLKLIPRFDNNSLDNSQNWDLMNELSPSLIIFSGSEITGYDETSKEEIRKTADLMSNNNIIFGMIEPFIAKQKGVNSLAHLLDFDILRVHSIQQEEMDQRANYDLDKIVDRYIRAVRERNVRLLYLKPFLEEKDNIPAEEHTLSYINSLSNEISELGYKPGVLNTYEKYKSPAILLILTGLGIVIAGIILLEFLLSVKMRKYYYLLIFLALLFEIGLIFIGRELFLRKLLALGSAVVFPSLAVISQLFAEGEEHLVLKFLKACIISLIGGVFLAASLAHISFILYIDQFTGVKLSFIIPIFLITLYYFYRNFKLSNDALLNKILVFLETKIKIKHVLLVFILAFAGLVYITRTGNNPIIPIPDIEVITRDLLEKLLYIRPRFKEFLIGHPFFILALGLAGKFKNELYYFLLVILASIGQINILNTFSHIHTPFFVSLFRTFHGIWLGLVLGIVLLFAVRYLWQLWDKKRSEYYG